MVGFVEALKRQAGAKDVIIDYKKGLAEATWKKSARFDYDALKKTVSKSAELSFKSLTLVAKGEVTEQDGKPAFKVTETGELFLLGEQTKGKDDSPLVRLTSAVKPGEAVVVTGRVLEPPKSKPPAKGKSDTRVYTLVVEEFKRG